MQPGAALNIKVEAPIIDEEGRVLSGDHELADNIKPRLAC